MGRHLDHFYVESYQTVPKVSYFWGAMHERVLDSMRPRLFVCLYFFYMIHYVLRNIYVYIRV